MNKNKARAIAKATMVAEKVVELATKAPYPLLYSASIIALLAHLDRIPHTVLSSKMPPRIDKRRARRHHRKTRKAGGFGKISEKFRKQRVTI